MNFSNPFLTPRGSRRSCVKKHCPLSLLTCPLPSCTKCPLVAAWKLRTTEPAHSSVSKHLHHVDSQMLFMNTDIQAEIHSSRWV